MKRQKYINKEFIEISSAKEMSRLTFIPHKTFANNHPTTYSSIISQIYFLVKRQSWQRKTKK
jgi:hypothetical protein